MKNKLIQLKGDNEAINIFIKKGSISQALKELEDKLESSRAFFEGAVVNKIIGESLSYRDMKLIEELLWNKFDISIKDTDILNDIDNEQFQPAEDENEAEDDRVQTVTAEDIKEAAEAAGIEGPVTAEGMNQALEYLNREVKQETLFLRTTVRSGQVISHDGNIVIIGDINPGGEVEADGHIAVFGNVKGVVKAGKSGDRDAFVVGVRLQPTQIGIAGMITRMPDGEVYQSQVPEIARISGEHIVIEELMKK